jgi:transposase-like protein
MPKTPPYSKEFRREAVQLLRSSGRPIPQLAKELGVCVAAVAPKLGVAARRRRGQGRGPE